MFVVDVIVRCLFAPVLLERARRGARKFKMPSLGFSFFDQLTMTTRIISSSIPRHSSQGMCLVLIQTFAVRLVLEVIGGAGAIWGCSEAVGLRNAANASFWRLVACLVGTIFFGRWLVQLRSFLRQSSSRSHQDELQDQDETNSLWLKETSNDQQSPTRSTDTNLKSGVEVV
jgi:hypothetical protein